MVIDFFTFIFAIFVLVLYVYLILVRKTIIIKSEKKKFIPSAIIIFSIFILVNLLILEQLPIQKIRGFLVMLLILSFLLDSKGFANDRLILGPFDNKGISYQEIDKLSLLVRNDKIRVNYFKNNRRGHMLTFSLSVEELLAFLSKRLREEAEVEILIDGNE